MSQSSTQFTSHGKIKNIIVKNFVTYDDFKVELSPNFNLILGANGSGKSSLLAAIVIGCGADPKVMGRSDNLTDFIKNGTSQATIELHIHDKVDLVIFRRVFNSVRDGFSINGKKTNRTQYVARIKGYNIHVDNMCQILPQDRVQDFSKMNKHELFINTLIAACKEDVTNGFQQLKEYRSNHKVGEESLAKSLAQLKELNSKLHELEPAMKRVEESNEMMKQKNLLKSKLLWLEYKKVKTELDQTTIDYNNAKSSYEREETELKQLQQSADSQVKTRANLQRRISVANSTLKAKKDEFRKYMTSLNEAHTKIKRARKEYEAAHSEIESVKYDIEKTKVQLENFEKLLRLKETTSAAETKSKIQNFQTQIREISKNIRAEESKIDEINNELTMSCNPELNLINKQLERDPVMDYVEQHHPDVIKAMQWIGANKNKLQGHIYNPIIFEIKPRQIIDGRYIENSISNRELLAIGCESKDDMQLLMKELMISKDLVVSFVHVKPSKQLNFKSGCTQQLQCGYGIEKTILDCIDGPPAIINYLCEVSRIHTIFIGPDHLVEDAENLPDCIHLLLTPTQICDITKSMFSTQKIVGVDNLEKARIFTGKLASERENLTERKIELQEEISTKTNALKKLRSNISSLESNRKAIKEELDQLVDILKNIDVIVDAIKGKKREIIALEEKEKSITEIEDAYTKKYIQFSNLSRKIFEKFAEIGCPYYDLKEKYHLDKGLIQIFDIENRELIDKISYQTAALKDKKSMVARIKSFMETYEKKATEFITEAKELSDGYSIEDKKFPYKNKYKSISDNIEELQELVEDIGIKLDVLNQRNSSIIANYKDLKNQAASVETLIERLKNTESKIKGDIDKLHSTIFPQIQIVIQNLNQEFMKFMKEIGYIGEIKLVFNENPMDYDKYGIEIMVKYRDTQNFGILDRNIHSGGERAVAIALYLLSLQLISSTPFRAVDELNQGMDTTNERNILNMMIREIAKEDSSQYIYITPKLVTKMELNEFCCATIIMNSPYLS